MSTLRLVKPTPKLHVGPLHVYINIDYDQVSHPSFLFYICIYSKFCSLTLNLENHSLNLYFLILIYISYTKLSIHYNFRDRTASKTSFNLFGIIFLQSCHKDFQILESAFDEGVPINLFSDTRGNTHFLPCTYQILSASKAIKFSRINLSFQPPEFVISSKMRTSSSYSTQIHPYPYQQMVPG